MIRKQEATGKTVDEARAKACALLGVQADDLNVSCEVLEMPQKTGFLGLKLTPAKVCVSVEEPDAPAAAPAEPVVEKKTPVQEAVKAAPVAEEPAAVAEQPEAKAEEPFRRKDLPHGEQKKSGCRNIRFPFMRTGAPGSAAAPVDALRPELLRFLSGLPSGDLERVALVRSCSAGPRCRAIPRQSARLPCAPRPPTERPFP